MKRGGDEFSATKWRQFGNQRGAPRTAQARKLAMLLQIHPLRASRTEILALAMRFLIEAAAKFGTSPPGFSEDAATFICSRQWDATDLAARVAHAVACNQGSLITADDLAES